MGDQALRDRLSRASGWEVQRQLGRGQYGTAYLVEWSSSAAGASSAGRSEAASGDRAVAKVVGLEFLPEKEKTCAFQEAELMRKLRHPHIVALIDHFLTEGSVELVIVMDFCDSGDLRGEVKRRAGAKPPQLISEAQVMVWFFQLTLALNYIHQRHILHRDLKSSNIFLTTSSGDKGGYDMKIGDFGIARVLEGTIDVAATVVGTPYYMSPEVCKSEPYGYKSDIWALGCVLYEMCMLKHAFESQSLLGLVYKIVSETYDPIPDIYSADLRALLDRVLDKSHYTRPTGKDLIADPYVRKYQSSSSVLEADGAAGVPGRVSEEPEQEDAPAASPTAAAPAQERAAAAAQPAGAAAAAQQQPPPSRGQQLPPKASLRPPGVGAAGAGMGRAAPPRSTKPQMGLARGPEPAPLPPDAAPGRGAMMGLGAQEEQPVYRFWTDSPPSPAGAGAQAGLGAGASSLPSSGGGEAELRAQVLLRRIHVALAHQRRQNWLQVFASFDTAGDGQLQEVEFEQALTSLALGLSDTEIREVRVFLQGERSGRVPVESFGAALHQSPQEALRLQEWGRNLVADLNREAAGKASMASGGVAPGAHVRVQGLTSAVGMKLNGSEGVVEKWDPSGCRWIIKLCTDGALKSIRDEQLLVLRPAAATAAQVANAQPETTALYRLLCEGGETAVPQERFTSVVQQLLPRTTEAECEKLLLLVPKTHDGRVDAPDLLGQFVTGSSLAEQTLRMPPLPGGAGVLGGGPPPSSPGGAGATMRKPSPLVHQHAGAGMGRPPPMGVPGTATPTASRAPPTLGPGGGGSSSSAPPAPPGGFGRGVEQVRLRAEVALLRLAQKLLGRPGASGPGLEVLRLFASGADEIRLDELLDAASVLPLGISRAEVQSIFAHVRASAGRPSGGERDVLPFALLQTATEAAHSAGVPSEAPALERLDASRLSSALQRLASMAGGRAAPQGFRFSLMQAEPYLTPHQLEWLIMLTDKDGEGQLLPRSLLARLCPERASSQQMGSALLPPRPPSNSRGSVARSLPRPVVVAAILARARDRLRSAGGTVLLERALSLFELDGKAQLPRGGAASLLAQLRLGISYAEADAVVAALPGAGGGGGGMQPLSSHILVSTLLEAVQNSGDAESEAVVMELREAARLRFLGRGEALAASIFAADAGDQFVSQADFRRCLSAALADNSMAQPLDEESEDRFVLLAEKKAGGEVRWRPFAERYAGWQGSDAWSDCGTPSLTSPSGTGAGWRRGGAGGLNATTGPSGTQQSWRSAKTQARAMAGSGPDTIAEGKPCQPEDLSTAEPTRCGCCIS